MLRRRNGRSQTATPECGMDNTAVFGPVRIFQHPAKTALRMYRTVDVVGLLVSGGCFILASGLAILHRARRRTAGRVVDIQQELDRILADTTATSVGTSVAPTPAMTVDRAKLLQLREQLDVLLRSEEHTSELQSLRH